MDNEIIDTTKWETMTLQDLDKQRDILQSRLITLNECGYSGLLNQFYDAMETLDGLITNKMSKSKTHGI